MPKPKVEKDTSERWTVTYSDLMNLLLILFIILYSMSKLDAQKAEQVQQSLGTGFSNMVGAAAIAAANQGQDAGAEGGDSKDVNTYWVEDEYKEFYKEISLLIKNNNLEDMVEAAVDDTGVVISFKDNSLFVSGSADLSDSAISVIDQIGGLLSKLQYSFVLVEGHTDTDPILGSGMFKDNMDLSSARAGNVWRELVKCGIPPEKMASIGYGEYRPIAPNDTAENKSKNRRVVISILKMPFTASKDLVANDLPQDSAQSSASASPEASPSGEESASPSVSPSESSGKSSGGN